MKMNGERILEKNETVKASRKADTYGSLQPSSEKKQDCDQCLWQCRKEGKIPESTLWNSERKNYLWTLREARINGNGETIRRAPIRE